MGYVDSNLGEGETVLHRAYLHWIVYLPAIQWFVVFVVSLAFLLSNSSSTTASEGEATVAIFSGLGVIIGVVATIGHLITGWITKWSTELAVTNRRVIAKFGFIRRDTIELNHSKVESFSVDQSILGRILGYGTLTVNGTGGIRTPIPKISAPLDFRSRAMQALES